MSLLSGRRTRDIAVAAEAGLASRMTADAEHHQRIEAALRDQDEDRRRLHAENHAEILRLHQRIDSVESYLNALPWKLIGAIGAMLAAATGLIGWLLAHPAAWPLPHL